MEPTINKFSEQSYNSAVRSFWKGGITVGAMSRVVYWLTHGPFAIVGTGTSEQWKDKTWHQAQQDLWKLRNEVINDGYGFYPGQGVWKGKKTEPSLLIANCPFADALRYGRAYRQDKFIWGRGGTYASYKTDTGLNNFPPKNVMGDFTALEPEELKKIKPFTGMDAEITATWIRGEPARPWSADSVMREWRKRRSQAMNSIGLGVPYFVISDSVRCPIMMSFNKMMWVQKVADGQLHSRQERGPDIHLPACFCMSCERLDFEESEDQEQTQPEVR